MKNLSILVFVLTLTVLGCKMPSVFESANSNSNSNIASNTQQTASSDNAPVEPSNDAKADIVRTSRKFLAQSRFSATMDGEGKMPMHVDLEYQAPDRFRMISNPGGLKMETIIIGHDMYMKQGDRWQKLPGALGKTLPQIREFFDEKGIENLSNVTYVGEDTVDGKDTYLYTYKSDAKKGEAPYPFTSKIWVRAADGLPAKIEVTYEGGDLKRMNIAYDFEKPVNIEPPNTK